jgi:hypothetical protein
MGLFARATWLELFRQVGFAPSVVVDASARDLFVGVRPSAS